jgi:hypothetical protein
VRVAEDGRTEEEKDRLIMEYTIVSGYQVANVVLEVNKHLKDGWKLCGNLVVGATPDRDGDLYAQAMTRDKPGEFRQSELRL